MPGSVIWDAIQSPIITLYILILVGIWVKVYTTAIDIKPFTFGFKEFIYHRQWWRILTSSLCHESFLHLFVNVTTLWSYRLLEVNFGSTTLINMQTNGFSTELLAWVAFNSITSHTTGITGYVLGIIPLPSVFAPAFMMIIIQSLVPNISPLVNLSGLMSGFLLAIGLLQILPSLYWSLCFFLNTFLIICWGHFIAINYKTNETNENIFDIVLTSQQENEILNDREMPLQDTMYGATDRSGSEYTHYGTHTV
eukprot:gene12041-25232_t